MIVHLQTSWRFVYSSTGYSSNELAQPHVSKIFTAGTRRQVLKRWKVPNIFCVTQQIVLGSAQNTCRHSHIRTWSPHQSSRCQNCTKHLSTMVGSKSPGCHWLLSMSLDLLLSLGPSHNNTLLFSSPHSRLLKAARDSVWVVAVHSKAIKI